MCSIFGLFGLQPGDDVQALRRRALELSQRQRHRGPDWSGVHLDEGAILVHERLAIVDPAGGSQPLRSDDGELVLAVEDNGSGFSAATAGSYGGRGLNNIRERARAIGARVTWGTSRFTTGTRFELVLPLANLYGEQTA